ncbi:Cullin repeat-containing protein [Gyrodon lividus]|nr:Cullin repeat-containing protein [Gyrodon lividus]
MNSSANKLYTAIHSILDNILALQDSKNLSYAQYSSAYTVVYNLITTPFPPALAKVPGLTELEVPTEALRGGALYCILLHKLDVRLGYMIQGTIHLEGDALLAWYASHWEWYTSIARLLARVYDFHTQHWVLGAMKHRNDIYTAYILAMTRWKVVLVDGFQKTEHKLTKALLCVVASQREGEPANKNHVISVLSSLTSLGRSGKNGKAETLEVYEDVFERPYLNHTTTFHVQSAQLLISISQGSMVEYVQTAEQWFLVEEKIASMFPSEETRNRLMKTLKGVLLEQYSKALCGYASKSIAEARHANIKDLYTLYAHVQNGVVELRGMLGEAAVRNPVNNVALADD